MDDDNFYPLLVFVVCAGATLGATLGALLFA